MTEMTIIRDEDTAFYHENGYLLIENMISDEWLQSLRSASAEFVEDSRALTSSSRILDVEPNHSAETPRLRRLVSPLEHHETFRRFTLEGPAAEIALALLGNPVRFHHSKLNYKWAAGGEEVKWHQDIQFWPHTDFSPLTIGVYLEDVDDEMGPMGVLPGSHKGALYDQYDGERWAGALKQKDADQLDLGSVVWLKGKAGSMTVHNCCMIHGSMPNNSLKARPLLLQTYSAQDSYPVRGIGANGNLGGRSGTMIGSPSPQVLTVEGRSMRGAPDWAQGGTPTIFGSQQAELK